MRDLRAGSPRRRLLFGAGALAFSALLLAGPLSVRGLLSSASVSTERVERGRFVREVTGTGTLKAVEATPVIVPTDSEGPQKIGWMATDGSLVKKGDPVVLFDPSEMEKTLADGVADRKTAVNKIEKTTAENRRTDLGLGLELDVAREEMAQAESFAPKDLDIFSRNEIIESQIDRELLEKRFDAAGAKKDSSAKLGAADVALGQIERSKAEIRVRQAEKGLGSLRVLAPHDGLLVFERGWRGEMLSVGETVFPGQKIAEIPDLSAVEARVYVLEADAGGLKAGLAARVSIEGRTGEEHAAKVSRVDAMAKTRNWRLPTKFFEAILSLDRSGSTSMKPGQSVKAVILLEEIAGVVSVPRGAIFEKEGKRLVHRLEGDRFVPVEVTVGRSSLSRVVIEKGLEAGDRIALRDPTRAASEIFQGREGGRDGSETAAPAGGSAGTR